MTASVRRSLSNEHTRRQPVGFDALGVRHMGRVIMQRFLSLLLVAFMVAPPALAGTLTIPNEFTNGTVADADEMDANFNATKAAVNDNDARLDALHETDTCITPPCSLEDGTSLGGSSILSTEKSGIYMATDYEGVAASTVGIQGAIDAACAAGGGVVRFTGTLATSATIDVNCEGVILEGGSRLDTIVFTAGTTGIQVSGDKTRLRNFKIIPSGSDASSTAIYVSDDTTSAAADVRLENLWIQGYAGGLGTGVYCRTCLRSGIFESSVIGWNQGIYLQDEDAPTDIDPNVFAIVSTAVRTNTSYGLRVIDLTSTVSITGGSTFENNGIGARCDSPTGLLYSNGTHWENSGSANIYRQAGSGCGIFSVADKMGGTTTTDYWKLSDGATKDVFIGTYWATGINNATDSCVIVMAPANTNGVTAGDTVDLDHPQTCLMDVAQDTTLLRFFFPFGLFTASDCSSYVTEGQVCWDSDDDALYVGDGLAAVEVAGSGGGMSTADIDTSAELRTIVTDESGTGAMLFAGGAIGAATATTPAADDNDTSVATTAYVQGELNGAAGTGLVAASGVLAVDSTEAGFIANDTTNPSSNGALVVDTNGDGSNVTHDVLVVRMGSENFYLIPVREYPSANGVALVHNATNDDLEWLDVALETEVAGYTTSASAPTDGVDACETGDQWLKTSATVTLYGCVDGATDDWEAL